MPTTSVSMPSGNGGTSGVPSTSWLCCTRIGVSRPGSARSGSIIFVFSRNRNMSRRVVPRCYRDLTRAAFTLASGIRADSRGSRRGGRVAEGTRLLSEYGEAISIAGSNPALSARGGYTARPQFAPVAQLDRASVYGTEGQRFESSRARYESPAAADL